jgi:hypothetical protein
MPLLEAFAGKQPDSRLYEVSIRHWDDDWFGKLHVYGDIPRRPKSHNTEVVRGVN